jgi:hypothetical protein
MSGHIHVLHECVGEPAYISCISLEGYFCCSECFAGA